MLFVNWMKKLWVNIDSLFNLILVGLSFICLLAIISRTFIIGGVFVDLSIILVFLIYSFNALINDKLKITKIKFYIFPVFQLLPLIGNIIVKL